MDSLVDRIKVVLIEGLNLDEVAPDDIGENALLFGDAGLGLDSIDALELVIEIERNFGVQIRDDAKSREILTSVKTLADYVRSQGGE